MKVQVIWDVMLCSLVNGYQRFEGVFFPHPKGLHSLPHPKGLHSLRRMDFSDPVSAPRNKYLPIIIASYSRRLNNCNCL